MAKHNLNVSSSDLARARALTSLLTGPLSAPRASPETHGYVRFSAAVPAAAPPAAPPAVKAPAPAPAPSLPAPTFGGAAWDELISWCIVENPCDGGFLMDASGLVVTTQGLLPIDEIEALGAQLLVALDQTDRMSLRVGTCSTISLRLDEVCASGLRFSDTPGSSLLLCLIGDDPISDAVRHGCEKVVRGWYGESA